jgi:hypothetical protein
MLVRRPVTARTVTHIGKKANRLEEAQAGLIQQGAEIVASYGNPDQDAVGGWTLPVPRAIGVREVARRTGHSVGAVQAVLAGDPMPRRAALSRYLSLAASWASRE